MSSDPNQPIPANNGVADDDPSAVDPNVDSADALQADNTQDSAELAHDPLEEAAGEPEAADEPLEEAAGEPEAADEPVEEAADEPVEEAAGELEAADEPVEEAAAEPEAADEPVEEAAGEPEAADESVEEASAEPEAADEPEEEAAAEPEADDEPVEEAAGEPEAADEPVEEAAGELEAADEPVEEAAAEPEAADEPVEEAAGELEAADDPLEEAAGELEAADEPVEETAGEPDAADEPVDEAAADDEDDLLEEEDEDDGTGLPVEEATEEEEGGEPQWYILKVQVNREDSICRALERRVKMQGLEDVVPEVVVPVEEIAEFNRSGKRRIVRRKLFPGYIMVNMVINDDTWFLVRETPGIGDFTGSVGKPTPMDPHEVERILKTEVDDEDEEGQVKTAIPFKTGDRVRVKDGYFQNFEGDVDEIDEANGRVTVMINIFGRSTPVELEHWQIEDV